MKESILEMLREGNVVKFDVSKENCAVREACDYWYDIDLNKAQLLQLSEEIKQLAEGMEDSQPSVTYSKIPDRESLSDFINTTLQVPPRHSNEAAN